MGQACIQRRGWASAATQGRGAGVGASREGILGRGAWGEDSGEGTLGRGLQGGGPGRGPGGVLYAVGVGEWGVGQGGSRMGEDSNLSWGNGAPPGAPVRRGVA